MGCREYLYKPFCNKEEHSFGVGKGERFLLSCNKAKVIIIPPKTAMVRPIFWIVKLNFIDQSNSKIKQKNKTN